MKNTSDEDDINHIVAYGLILIAVIGILGLIGIAALWGPQTDLTANQNVGPIVVITSAAVGALAGVLSARVLASPLTQDIPRWAMHAAVCVLVFVAVAGTSVLLIGPPLIHHYLNENYPIPNQAIGLVSATVGIFGGILMPKCKKEVPPRETTTR